MIRTKITCDQCDREKQQTNHWVVAFTDAKDGHLDFRTWDAALVDINNDARHLCGRECAQKELEQWLEKVSQQ